MFKVDEDYRMTLTRGDSASFTVTLEDDDGVEYALQQDDFLTFTIKRDTTSAKPLVQKVSADGSFQIDPQDTERLSYGDYRYDVQLTKGGSVIDTVITPKPFIVGEEVTW